MFEVKKTRDLMFIGAVVAVALVFGLVFRMRNGASAAGEIPLVVRVQVNGEDVLRVPLSENAAYLVTDGEARAVADGEITEEALTSRHDWNLILIEYGSVRCADSDCENRVCVHTPALTEEAYDTPIVCMPHGMFVYLVKEDE